ncbi:TIM barrel protein [Vibrio alginolyticus]|uniref:TIM barrel protein n=1 Tax=Vibrio alginolyticus TaxID=663 RepID=UPI0022DD20AB|nr:TIM barrel protein [Vibrio alginolyticus]MDA0420465.1 TIM barrel protein [Vibrio alginolyticus]
MKNIKSRLSVSNFAWPAENADWCYNALAEHNIGAIEVAPTKAFGDWKNITAKNIRGFHRHIEAYGLRVSSLQGITFGVPSLSLHPEQSRIFLQHCSTVASLLVDLDADYAVFGAAKLRSAPVPEQQELEALFAKVAEIFAEKGKALALEPIPKAYGADCLHNLTQCKHLVEQVNSRSLVLQFDTANQFLASDLISANYRHSLAFAKHLHISEPDLRFFFQPSGFNVVLSHEIQQLYNGKWIVLEMGEKNFSPFGFLSSLKAFTQLYRNSV